MCKKDKKESVMMIVREKMLPLPTLNNAAMHCILQLFCEGKLGQLKESKNNIREALESGMCDVAS